MRGHCPLFLINLSTSMADSRFTLKPLLVIFAGMMAVTAMVLNGITWSRVRESVNAVDVALQKRYRSEALLSSLTDAETGVRGYVITGEATYLEPFEGANASIDETLHQLRDLTHGPEPGKASFGQLDALVRERMDALKEVIVVREREGFEAARALVLLSSGKSLMDELRQSIASMTRKQQEVVQEMTAEVNRDLRWGYASALGAGLTALGSGLIAFLLLRDALHHAGREQRLTEEKRRAESADRDKSVFLATMSHEIRTPMNAILGFGELLRDHINEPKARQYAESIVTSGRALLQIINDILDLSKVEAGMLELTPVPTDLRDTARFILQLFSHQVSKRGVELRVDVQDDLPASLLIDNLRLRQILVNVVGNALKFTECGHVNLRVRTIRNPAHPNRVNVFIEVEDTGKGIPKEQQEAVFLPFVQAPGGKTTGPQGTGLGLAIVLRLTRLMGGTVTLESEAGRGSLFRFEFPDIEISPRLALSATEEPDATVDFNELQPSTLLVADDNQTNLDLVAGIFADSHHVLRFARNGREVLEAIREERPDLVMLDIRMPIMDGREALAAIRSNSDWKLLPVIAVTASSLADEGDFQREKFDGYVRKPFSRAQLYDQLAQFIPACESPDAALRANTSRLDAPQSPDVAQKWRALGRSLSEIRETDWPAVRDGLAVSDIHAFAAKLESLASDAHCGPLDTYSRRLHSDAASFSPAALEETLLDFPEIIAAIQAATAIPVP